MFNSFCRKLLFVIPLLVLHFISNGQTKQKFTISGYVKEAKTGEYMIGANVYLKEVLKGTATNQYGFYSLTFDEGE